MCICGQICAFLGAESVRRLRNTLCGAALARVMRKLEHFAGEQ